VNTSQRGKKKMIKKFIFYWLVCDCCKETMSEDMVGTRKEIKEIAREQGWHFIRSGKKQKNVLCDRCFEKYAPKEDR
jgi:hypothetical protein